MKINIYPFGGPMEDNQEELGKYARHPVRTAGMAFLAGALLGAGLGAKKGVHKRSSIEKFIDQIGL